MIGCPHPDFGGASPPSSCAQTGSADLDEKYQCSALKDKTRQVQAAKRVLFVDDLPRNTMGKVQKNVLREQNISFTADKARGQSFMRKRGCKLSLAV